MSLIVYRALINGVRPLFRLGPEGCSSVPEADVLRTLGVDRQVAAAIEAHFASTRRALAWAEFADALPLREV